MLYNGKLSREENFCGYTRKFSPQDLGRSKSKQSTKVFSAKTLFFTSLWKPSKVYHCTVIAQHFVLWYMYSPLTTPVVCWASKNFPATLRRLKRTASLPHCCVLYLTSVGNNCGFITIFMMQLIKKQHPIVYICRFRFKPDNSNWFKW